MSLFRGVHLHCETVTSNWQLQNQIMRKSIEQCIKQHERRPVRFLRDPAGMVVAGFTWSIMILSLCALWFSISFWLGPFSVWGLLEGIVVTGLIAMCMWSHYMVMTTDPGFVPRKKAHHEAKVYGSAQHDTDAEDDDVESELDEEDIEMPLEELENMEDDGSLLVFCDDCNLYRPTSPWVNNCVGVGNQKFFLLFLFYVAATSAHVLLLVVLQRTTCTSGQAFCGFDAGKFPGQLGMYLLAASCVFGLFCTVMLAMEIYSIDDDMIFSNIAKRLHVRTGCKSKSRVERHLSVLCGTNGFQWTWLLPLPMQRNRQDWQIIGGFGCGGDSDEAGAESV